MPYDITPAIKHIKCHTGLDPASRSTLDTAFAGVMNSEDKIIDITTEFAYISAIGKRCLIKPGSFRSRPLYPLVSPSSVSYPSGKH
jgi:hypothetical protein